MNLNSSRIGVMHITDTLEIGGAERVAVNLANLLPRERYESHLCATRHDGPLSDMLSSDVGRLYLGRRSRYDIKAVRRLAGYLKQNRITILHAHASSLFMAAAASLLPPYPVVIWHDHFGRYLSEERPVWLYRVAAKRLGGVIAVNHPLAEWSKKKLQMPGDRVWYVPNFACGSTAVNRCADLPGSQGSRIVCVANLRSQKDHPTLLAAMSLVVRQVPDAHLLLVGGASDAAYLQLIKSEIECLNLSHSVSILGERKDVGAILHECDIGVLSSASEGLPLALIEYGMARLPVVATQVGQCGEVLDDSRAGKLVPPSAPEALARALMELLRSPSQREALGEIFYRRTQQFYSPRAIIKQICHVYDTVTG